MSTAISSIDPSLLLFACNYVVERRICIALRARDRQVLSLADESAPEVVPQPSNHKPPTQRWNR